VRASLQKAPANERVRRVSTFPQTACRPERSSVEVPTRGRAKREGRLGLAFHGAQAVVLTRDSLLGYGARSGNLEQRWPAWNRAGATACRRAVSRHTPNADDPPPAVERWPPCEARPLRYTLDVLIENAFNPIWSPDGRKISFKRETQFLREHLYVADADGSMRGSSPATQPTTTPG